MASERSIHEMLRDAPSLGETSAAVAAGAPLSMTHSQSMPLNVVTTSSHPSQPHNGAASALVRSNSSSSRLDSMKSWSISAYKCTKQLVYEKLGKSTRTVDTELEAWIARVRDTQRRYAGVLREARALALHAAGAAAAQRALAEALAELAQRSPELRDELARNADAQRRLARATDQLLAALRFFASSLDTLCSKTIEDALLTVKQYEAARIEYDAYRADAEAAAALKPSSSSAEEAKRECEQHRLRYERLREDVTVKLKFLDENRIKVMHKQLLLFHNAVSAYFSGNATALESTLKQFNIKHKSEQT